MCAKIFLNKTTVIEINNELIENLLCFRQLGNEPESGGVFVGKRLFNETILIVDFSKPSKKDFQRRYHFPKKSSHHQKLVDEHFTESQGYISLIGEWHTHPEEIPIASRVDKRSWNKIIEENKDERLFFLIIGNKSCAIYFRELTKWRTVEINLERDLI